MTLVAIILAFAVTIVIAFAATFTVVSLYIAYRTRPINHYQFNEVAEIKPARSQINLSHEQTQSSVDNDSALKQWTDKG